MEEVREKERKITASYEDEYDDLEEDPVEVVLGPNRDLFIVDHHHAAAAWIRSGHPDVLCRIRDWAGSASEEDFWRGLVRNGLVRLADANGKQIKPSDLPRKLEELPDDPYRSLAWMVRKAKGYCRSKSEKEFVEFKWADWLRQRPELPPLTTGGSARSMLPMALTLSRSSGASGLPGYIGDKPAGFKCPKNSLDEATPMFFARTPDEAPLTHRHKGTQVPYLRKESCRRTPE